MADQIPRIRRDRSPTSDVLKISNLISTGHIEDDGYHQSSTSKTSRPNLPERQQSMMSTFSTTTSSSRGRGGMKSFTYLDDQVGPGFNNVFVTDQHKRLAGARAGQHLSSGPIKTLQTPKPTPQFGFRFANYDSVILSEGNGTTITPRKTKRRKLNPRHQSALPPSGNQTSMTWQMAQRQWTFPTEIWLHIFEYAGLETMIKAQELHPALRVCLQQSESVWKTCRIMSYGSSAPDPVPGTTEQEHAVLVVGRGCQGPLCPRTNTEKVYWAFQRRLCTDCYRSSVVKLSDLADNMQRGPKKNLLKYIQAGTVSGGKYSHCRRVSPTDDAWAPCTDNKLVYMRRDVAVIERQYDAAIAAGQTPEEVFDDWEPVRIDVLKRAKSIEGIEEWHSGISEGESYRVEREHFFVEEALKLPQHINHSMLRTMLPFTMDIVSNREPNKEQWEILKAKIVPLRDEAMRIVDVDSANRVASFPRNLSPRVGEPGQNDDLSIFKRLHDHRKSRESAEQLTVLRIAQAAFEKLVGQVHDQDLILMLLRQTRARWSPDFTLGMNIDSETGPYELTLDDARLVVSWAEKELERLNHVRHADIFDKFRCPACPRADKVKRYKFVELFDHLQKKHTCYVSEYSVRMRKIFLDRIHSGLDFPWYTIPWFENLPILANHQSPNPRPESYIWDFDTPKQYIEAPVGSNISAFYGRIIIYPHAVEVDDFSGCVLHAGEKLSATALPAELQTTIALKFALHCYATKRGPEQLPSLDELVRTAEALSRSSSTENKLKMRFACGICTSDGTVDRSSQWVRHARAFNDLLSHFRASHLKDHCDVSWVDGLFALIDDKQLKDELDKADRTLIELKRKEAIKQKQRRQDAKKRPSEKAAVVLKTPAAWDVFAELWKEDNTQIVVDQK